MKQIDDLNCQIVQNKHNINKTVSNIQLGQKGVTFDLSPDDGGNVHQGNQRKANSRKHSRHKMSQMMPPQNSRYSTQR